MLMNLSEAREGEEYIVKDIVTDDEELMLFFFSGVLQWRTDYSDRSQKGRLCSLY